MSNVCLFANGCLERSAGLDALAPRVINLCIARTSAVSVPSTTATATTNFPGFRDGAAFGTHGTDGRRNDCWCLHVGNGQSTSDFLV